MSEDWSWKPNTKDVEKALEHVRQGNAITKKHATALGMSWPPRKGWKKALLGKKRSKKKQRVYRKKKNEFYQSWEWKKARFETLKKYGAVCMCCGSEHRIVVDHIKPLRHYPELALNLDNLQVLCNDCNMGKSHDDETDFRPDNYTSAELQELELINQSDEHLH